MIVIKTPNRHEVEEYLSYHPNVNNLFVINGGYDFMVESVFKDEKEYAYFLRELEEKGAELTPYTLLGDLRRECFEL